MKAVILAGGLGTRLAEETSLRPKPMVEIGSRPILWHIMKSYYAAGIDEFIVCLGYKGYLIKEYFANYNLHTSDVTFDLAAGSAKIHHSAADPWKVTLVETGDDSMTGGRLRRVLPYIDDENFCFTYGDGLTDLDFRDLIDFHRREGRIATVTAVQPPGRFGVLEIDPHGPEVKGFAEKPRVDGAWINGGFFVLNRDVARYLADDSTVWEHEPMRQLAADGQLSAYRHDGFWKAMDTLRERREFEEMWASGEAPWKTWREE